MTRWQRTRKVASILCHGWYSLRILALKLKISINSARHQKLAFLKRSQTKVGLFFETKEGNEWIVRLVIVSIFFLGLNRSNGDRTISQFLIFMEIDHHIGVSKSSIARLRERIEKLIANYTKEQIEAVKSQNKTIETAVGGDETFFPELLVLILMDLRSGFIFLEEGASDRTYKTWSEKGKAALESWGVKAMSFTSDRAKALMKLAVSGLKCLYVSDLFHHSHSIVKVIGFQLSRKIQKAKSDIIKEKKLSQSIKKGLKTQSDFIDDNQALSDNVLEVEKELSRWEGEKDRYQKQLHKLSKTVHPFDLETGERKSSKEVEDTINNIAEELNLIISSCKLSDKKKRIQSLADESYDITQLIDTWWMWIQHDVDKYSLTDDGRLWLTDYLLPCHYWKKQVLKTSNKELKTQYQNALKQAEEKLYHHPLTKIMQEDLWTINLENWAQRMVGMFQRTSSAVEGRNGYLQQHYHTHRGLTEQRLKVLTAIHNFDIRGEDGKTPAERLFDQKFPNLLEYVVKNMGDMPLPRNRKSKEKNPYYLRE